MNYAFEICRHPFTQNDPMIIIRKVLIIHVFIIFDIICAVNSSWHDIHAVLILITKYYYFCNVHRNFSAETIVS